VSLTAPDDHWPEPPGKDRVLGLEALGWAAITAKKPMRTDLFLDRLAADHSHC
jgi:hypothetical protein